MAPAAFQLPTSSTYQLIDFWFLFHLRYLYTFIMAEVIGVVSGALTFATVVVQVTQSIIKIKDCWDQVRDAPEDLQRLVREVETYGLILANVENQLSNTSTASILQDNSYAIESFELCKTAAEDLDAVAKGLMDEIRPRKDTKGVKKAYASLKVVIKKGSVEKYRTRLGNATRLLFLSHQCYTTAMIQRQPELIAAKVLGSLQESRDLEVPESNEHNDDTKMQRRRKHAPSSYKDDFLWRLALPSWLGAKCFELTGARVPNGWKYHFKTYRIVPWKSESMKLTRDGDIKGLQRLFSSGEATILEQDTVGFTLLTTAFTFGQPDTARFLLEEGAEIDTLDYGPMSPLRLTVRNPSANLHWSTWSSTIEERHQQSSSLRLLSNYYDDFQSYEHNDFEKMFQLLLDFRGSIEDFKFLQENFYSSHYEAPPQKLCELAKGRLLRLSPFYYVPDEIDIARPILHQIPLSTPPESFKSYSAFLDSLHILDLPNIISRNLGHFSMFKQGRLAFAIMRDLDPLTRRRSEIAQRREILWREVYRPLFDFFREFLAGGMDINQVDHEGCSPFMAFCDGYLGTFGEDHQRFTTQRCNTAFRSWLQDLKNSGVDLQKFGKKEENRFKLQGGPKDYFPEFDNWYAYWWGPVDQDASRRLIGFSHGPCPEDWNFWISDDDGVFCGQLEFWEMIERRIEMPGAWSSDVHLFL